MHAVIHTLTKSYVDVRYMTAIDVQNSVDRLVHAEFRGTPSPVLGRILTRSEECFAGQHYLIGIDRIPASADVIQSLVDGRLTCHIGSKDAAVAMLDGDRASIEDLRQEITQFRIAGVRVDAHYAHVQCVHSYSDRVARVLFFIDATTQAAITLSRDQTFCPDAYRALSNNGFDCWRFPRSALGCLAGRLVTARLDDIGYYQPVIASDLLSTLTDSAELRRC